MENGIVIGRPINGISLNGLEYLLTEDNDYWHFETVEAAMNFLAEKDIDDDEVVLQYHVRCKECNKEFFLDPSALNQENKDGLLGCSEC